MAAVMPPARDGWAHHDSADYAVLAACRGGRGRQRDRPGQSKPNEALLRLRTSRPTARMARLRRWRPSLPLTQGRWSDARSTYVRAERDLQGVGRQLLAGDAQPGGGHSRRGHLPEADRGMAAAEEFFRGVGAESFVERYRAAFVPGPAEPVEAVASPATSEVPST